MNVPFITHKEKNLVIVDNILDNNEADIIGRSVFNKPTTGEKDFYYFNQLYSMQHGNTLKYNHEARSVIERINFKCMQLMKYELEIPTIKLEYSGISVTDKTYGYHADNSVPVEDIHKFLGMPSETSNDFSTFVYTDDMEWTHNNFPLRYYSTILFLNSNFSGGEEIFPQHKLEVTPRQGRLIIFPSTKEYIHGVRKATNGTRYALYSWYHKVFTYYDQKKFDQTKNLDNIRMVIETVEKENLLTE